ncbi:MAG: glycosyltransferase family 1 protein [Patescibacteria group bacterium]
METDTLDSLTIAIDGNEANVKARVGVNNFAFEVIWGIYRQRRKQDRYLIFLARPALEDFPPEGKNWHYEIFGPPKFWTRIALPKRLFFGKPKPDVILSLSHYGPGWSPIPSIVSIMDLGFLHWQDQFTKKDLYQLRNWTRSSVKKAKRVISISEFTRQDLIKNYQIKPERIVVAYPGFTSSNKDRSSPRKIKTPANYLLTLGTLKPSKNLEGIIRALDILVREKGLDLGLVIAGKKGWLFESIFDLVKELHLSRRVVFTGYINEAEKKTLLRGAKLFVMPSFWEGFGIPALEAMAAKLPVVCSDRGSFPEITGQAAVLVNPHDHRQLADKIFEVLSDKKIREKMIEAGKKQVKLFDWKNCSRIILETVYELVD